MLTILATLTTLTVSGQSQHALHALVLTLEQGGLFLKPSLPRRLLVQELVVVVGLPARDLARARDLEPLGGRLVGFQLCCHVIYPIEAWEPEP